MNDMDKIFFETYNNISAFSNSVPFNFDTVFNKKTAFSSHMPDCLNSDTRLYAFDFYLCMLCADVPENMILPAGAYRSIENIPDNQQISRFWSDFQFDPYVAAYSGRFDFAQKLMDINGDYDYSRMTETRCWDLIDIITDKGQNKKHIEIITALLVKDYLRGKNNLFEYIARYNKNELLTYGEAIDIALLNINSTDRLFMGISLETKSILIRSTPDTDRKKFNERAIGLMRRCARLGLTLKEFHGFDNILLPVYTKERLLNEFHIFRDSICCPGDIAKLIDENTDIYPEYRLWEDYDTEMLCLNGPFNDGDTSYEYFGSYYPPVYFLTEDPENNIAEKTGELEYICRDFSKRYGHRLTLKIENTNGFLMIQSIPRDLFDIYLCKSVLEEFYTEINKLKSALNLRILSQKNIDAITEYFASKLSSSKGKEHSFALKRLNQLNNKLIKMGGKIK